MGVPIALPIVADGRFVLGAIVLLNPPPFDLEDETFVLAWTQYKYSLIQSLRPRRREIPAVSEMALMRTMEGGHSFLHVILDLAMLEVACDRERLPYARVRTLVERQLSQLVGPHGAVFPLGNDLSALFVLPQKMDQDHLWHQIESTLRWPAHFSPQWQRKVLRSPAELQRVLGR